MPVLLMRPTCTCWTCWRNGCLRVCSQDECRSLALRSELHEPCRGRAVSLKMGTIVYLLDSVSLGHSKDFFDGCRISVFPSKPAELFAVFTGYVRRTCRC